LSGYGCVQPSRKTIADSSYQPLSRPVFIYVKKSAATRPEVEAFTNLFGTRECQPSVTSWLRAVTKYRSEQRVLDLTKVGLGTDLEVDSVIGVGTARTLGTGAVVLVPKKF